MTRLPLPRYAFFALTIFSIIYDSGVFIPETIPEPPCFLAAEFKPKYKTVGFSFIFLVLFLTIVSVSFKYS